MVPIGTSDFVIASAHGVASKFNTEATKPRESLNIVAQKSWWLCVYTSEDSAVNYSQTTLPKKMRAMNAGMQKPVLRFTKAAVNSVPPRI